MQNVAMSVRGSVLTIVVQLDASTRASKTGKTQIIATTGGGVPLPEKPEIKVGLNVYK